MRGTRWFQGHRENRWDEEDTQFTKYSREKRLDLKDSTCDKNIFLDVTGGFLITDFLFDNQRERNSTVPSRKYYTVITGTLGSEIPEWRSQQLRSRSAAWQQPCKSTLTPLISFTLPAPFKEQQEASDICRRGQGSARVVVGERLDVKGVCEIRILHVVVFSNERKKRRGAGCKQRQVSC